MTSLSFLDANVILALIWERHEHSERARAWFDETIDEQLLYCRLAQLAVLRLLTTERVMGHDARTMAEAWRDWDQLTVDSRVDFVVEPANLEWSFRRHSSVKSKSPKMWADSYLLAFASIAGLRLVTFDRALGSRAREALVL